MNSSILIDSYKFISLGGLSAWSAGPDTGVGGTIWECYWRLEGELMVRVSAAASRRAREMVLRWIMLGNSFIVLNKLD